MYFALSKTLGFLAIPTNLIVCLALAGLVLLVFRRPSGKIISIAALAAFVVAALSPLGNMLLTPLEQRFPGMKFPEQKIDGIIILGGSYDHVRGYLGTISFGENTGPMVAVADLARRYPQAKVVFSGGSAVTQSYVPAEAIAAKQLFVSFGIDAGRILIEDRSRNTEENARLTALLVKPDAASQWLLVTNAFHMPRAMGAFRKAGFSVTAFPVGWRTHGWRDFFWPAPSATENLRRVDVAMREWAGLIVYRLLGYSAVWFPR